jgi:hypothetical protein
MLYVEKYDAKIPSDAIVVNTTSRANDWMSGLSPFKLYGGHLYSDYFAENVENAWQASKVYSEFVDEDQNPTPEYFEWADKIWKSTYAFRYPMGKGRKPLYSYWDGAKLSYIEARKRIYIPIYSRAVIVTEAFQILKNMFEKEVRDIYLIDFDGYNHIRMKRTMEQVINDPYKKMGHAFVLYSLLIKEVNIKPLF